jgi:hypothetical protein
MTETEEMDALFPRERPQFEFVCLANHVEVQNGLLYIAGGGWTDHNRVPKRPDGQPTLSRLGIAAIVKIPWNETNKPQHFKIEVTALDAENSLVKIEGDINVGRAASLPPGSAQYFPIAGTVDVVFPQAGSYLLRGTLNEESGSLRTWEFRVHDLPQPSNP